MLGEETGAAAWECAEGSCHCLEPLQEQRRLERTEESLSGAAIVNLLHMNEILMDSKVSDLFHRFYIMRDEARIAPCVVYKAPFLFVCCGLMDRQATHTVSLLFLSWS